MIARIALSALLTLAAVAAQAAPECPPELLVRIHARASFPSTGPDGRDIPNRFATSVEVRNHALSGREVTVSFQPPANAFLGSTVYHTHLGSMSARQIILSQTSRQLSLTELQSSIRLACRAS